MHPPPVKVVLRHFMRLELSAGSEAAALFGTQDPACSPKAPRRPASCRRPGRDRDRRPRPTFTLLAAAGGAAGGALAPQRHRRTRQPSAARTPCPWPGQGAAGRHRCGCSSGEGQCGTIWRAPLSNCRRKERRTPAGRPASGASPGTPRLLVRRTVLRRPRDDERAAHPAGRQPQRERLLAARPTASNACWRASARRALQADEGDPMDQQPGRVSGQRDLGRPGANHRRCGQKRTSAEPNSGFSPARQFLASSAWRTQRAGRAPGWSPRRRTPASLKPAVRRSSSGPRLSDVLPHPPALNSRRGVRRPGIRQLPWPVPSHQRKSTVPTGGVADLKARC